MSLQQHPPQPTLPAGPPTDLYAIGLALTSAGSLEDAARLVLDATIRMTNGHHALVAILDHAGAIKHAATLGLTHAEKRALWATPHGLDFLHALLRQPPIIHTTDLDEYARQLGLDSFSLPLPINGALIAQLTHNQRLLGVLSVARKPAANPFSESDVAVFSLLANQASGPIANAGRRTGNRRTRRDLELLVHASPFGICVIDSLTRQPISINRQAVRILTPILSPGQNPADLLRTAEVIRSDGARLPFTELPFLLSHAMPTQAVAEPVNVSAPDGRSIAAAIRTTPIRNEDDVAVAMMITIETTPHQASRHPPAPPYLTTAASALRSPLSSVRGSATTLIETRHSLTPSESLEYLQLIVRQCDNIRSTIEHITDAAHIAAGSADWQIQPAAVSDVIHQAIAAFRATYPLRAACATPAHGAGYVLADRRRLPHAFFTILTEFATRTPSSTQLTVTCSQDSDQTRIDFSSTGTVDDQYPVAETLQHNHTLQAILSTHHAVLTAEPGTASSQLFVRITLPTLTSNPQASSQRETGPQRWPPLADQNPPPYHRNGLTIQYDRRLVTLNERPIMFTATEYAIIYELSRNAGQPMTHQDLTSRVWGPHRNADLRSLRSHISRIRTKLNESAERPRLILSETRNDYFMLPSE